MSAPINFYEAISAKFIKGKGTEKEQYKNFKKVKIVVPCRMLIVGKSGSMKTNTLLNLIKDIDAFDRYYLVASNLDQPLYQFLIKAMEKLSKKCGYDVLTAVDSIDQTPDIDKLHEEFPDDRILIIFDDIITEKNSKLKQISDIYVRGRSLNISVITISQSYYKLPSLIRANADYIILKSIIGKDVLRILSEYTIDTNKEDVYKAYEEITKNPRNFFMIDLKTTDDKLKFRENYTGIS